LKGEIRKKKSFLRGDRKWEADFTFSSRNFHKESTGVLFAPGEGREKKVSNTEKREGHFLKHVGSLM